MDLPRAVPARRIVGGQIAWGLRHRTSVLVMNVADWTLETTDRLFDETNGVAEPAEHNLIRMVGAYPSALARKRLAERQQALEAQRGAARGRTALLATSAMGRGAIMAWRWLTSADVAAYAPDEVAQAAAFVVPDHPDDLVEVYRRCCALLEIDPDR